MGADGTTGRARRGSPARLLAAALAAAALALGGCEALGEMASMVGLGGEKPAPPPPGPRRPPAPAAKAPAPAAAPGVRPAPQAAQAQARPAPAGGAAAAAKPAASPAGPAAPGTPAPGAKRPGELSLAGVEEPYDPTGKRDPFRPYVTKATLAAQREREGLTPLQKLEVSQLKLVAIVWGLRSNYAMVEDPAGVGYVLRVGTKVGTNGGRVARITPEAVFVDESFRDAAGGTLKNQVTLQLPRPSGGKGS